MTTSAVVYLRSSLDATGERLAVRRHREACQKIAADRRWTITREYVDNSIASNKTTQRPSYDAMVADYAAGKFEAMLCWDLDRLTRQPRELEDWIDAAEDRGLLLVTANGEADLATDGGRLFARIKVSVARTEMERKSARQKLAQRQRAQLGRPPKGVRLTGYTISGELVPAEAETVRCIFEQFTAGETLKGIARWLEETGVPVRRGGRWSSSTVSTILRNARYAGRSVYQGAVVATGTWPPLVSEAQFDAVAARLNDPRRTMNRADTARRHLGSGLYFCACGLPVRSSSGLGKGLHRYTCRNTCFYRSGVPVDAYVVAVTRERLGRPDLADLLARAPDKAALKVLGSERDELTARLAVIAADYDEGTIDGRRYAVATEKVTVRLSEVQRKQTALIATESTAAILGAPDPVGAFDGASLAIQRRIISALAVVTLSRGQHGSRTFRPETVSIRWA